MDDAMKTVQRLVDAWTGAGLDPDVLEPVTAPLARRAEIAREAAELRQVDVRVVVGDVADRVARGEFTLAQGCRELAAAMAPDGAISTRQASTRARVLEHAAMTATAAVALEAARRLPTGDVLAVLDKARSVVTARIGKLAPALKDITTFEAAAEAGRLTEWRSLMEANRERSKLADAWKALAAIGLVGDAERPAEFSTNVLSLVAAANANARAKVKTA